MLPSRPWGSWFIPCNHPGHQGFSNLLSSLTPPPPASHTFRRVHLITADTERTARVHIQSASIHHCCFNGPQGPVWPAKVRLLCHGMRANFGARPSTQAKQLTRTQRRVKDIESRHSSGSNYVEEHPGPSLLSFALVQQTADYLPLFLPTAVGSCKASKGQNRSAFLTSRNCLGFARLDSPQQVLTTKEDALGLP